MRAIDADVLTEDCKRYLGTLNPDKDGKECTRIHWLIGVLENAPTIDPEPCEDAVSRQKLLDEYSRLKENWNNADNAVDKCISVLKDLPSAQPETDCVLKEFGNCSYSETGCSDCKVKAKIRNALSAQPEPCEDAVSREAVSSWLKQYGQDVLHGKYKFSLMYIWKNLMDLPSAQPEPHWIPVTERLPKDDVEVIVSCTDDSGDTSFSYTTVAWHFKGTWICDNERCFFITAWMPLPEPYRAERRTDELGDS